MRTGPFSDPTIVNLINRYYVPIHLDNQQWSEARFGIEPAEENAYILLMTPDMPDVPGPDFRFLNRLSEVLQPATAREELVDFLEGHPELKQPPRQLLDLQRLAADDARADLVSWYLDEGDFDRALPLLDQIPDSQRSILFRARARRLSGDTDEAEKLLGRVSDSASALMERLRLAATREDWEAVRAEAAALRSLGNVSSEVFWWWGWAEHREGRSEAALHAWEAGLAQFPRDRDLYAQLAFFTLIRKNWDLPENVDQIP